MQGPGPPGQYDKGLSSDARAIPEQSLNDGVLDSGACGIPRGVVWLAFGGALLIYSNDWHPSGWTALRKEATAPKPPVSVAEKYTGSVVIVPTRGEDCRQMMLDNRTGRMWDKGIVNCYEAVSRPERDQRSGMSSLRINAIGKAFNRRDE